MIETITTIVHILTCFFMILVILLQSGKGGGVSAAFGGGAGAALGQRAATSVLGKATAFAAGLFMVTSMLLAVYSTPTAGDKTLEFVDEQGAAA
ncbi:MAG: preprotein translocase subunit SecG, partial [Myxococcales bacterium]|nr:preprotein translocase subunit SecG [Myxococcales bacterium]